MLKVILWVLGILALGLISFAVYFCYEFFRLPSLKLSPDMPRAAMAETVDEWARRLQQERKFNGIILIIRDGEPVLAEGFGVTGHLRDKQLTTASSMRIASLSKQFTAAAILTLVDSEQLSLDDSISKHIQNFPYPEVKIRHLLTQTSGIPDAYIQLASEHEADIDVLTNERVVQIIAKSDLPLESRPGDNFTYSNTNYVLLAHIVETVSGLSLEAYLEKTLFIPLHMENTRIWNLVSERAPGPNHTTGFNIYDDDPVSSEEKPGFLDGVSGDGAVHTSANDMVLWNRFWIDGAGLISSELIADAQSGTVLSAGMTSTYGYGWVNETDHVWHNGEWLAAQSMFLRSRDGASALLVVDNASSLTFNGIVKELRAAMPFR